MKDTSKLREIADALGLKTIVPMLSYIEEKINNKNAELIIPLVGEFSAGKTSLLNALTNVKLETAVKPTTSVIFEIRFGSKEQKAVKVFNNGDTSEITDIATIKNDELANVSGIKIFDTSTKIPSSVVLVDTPGLSSSNPTHQKVLVDYLPYADIILLVIDIEQGGLNASTLRFIKMAELAKKRIYIALAKCDSKSKNEIADVKQNTQKSSELQAERVICVSARDNKLDELYALIDTIQKDKNRIVEEITALRINNVKNEMTAFIDDLLDSAKLSTEELDKKIAGADREKEEIGKNIDSLLSDLGQSIDAIIEEQVSDFRQRMGYDLEASIDSLSKNDDEAKKSVIAQINNTANIYFANFKANVLRKLGTLARENRQKWSKRMLPLLSSLESFDMSGYNQNEFSYNFNLDVPEAKTINDGIVEGGKALLDLGSMLPYVGTVFNVIKNVAEASGALGKLAELITQEKLIKPQRKKQIENYFNESLRPDFERQLKTIGNEVVNSIQKSLNSSAEEKINEVNAAFETLRNEKETMKTEFKQRVDTLEEYKKILESQ